MADQITARVTLREGRKPLPWHVAMSRDGASWDDMKEIARFSAERDARDYAITVRDRLATQGFDVATFGF